jgi:hypothetical protein
MKLQCEQQHTAASHLKRGGLEDGRNGCAQNPALGRRSLNGDCLQTVLPLRRSIPVVKLHQHEVMLSAHKAPVSLFHDTSRRIIPRQLHDDTPRNGTPWRRPASSAVRMLY